MVTRLTAAETETHLEDLSSWQSVDGRHAITRSFLFKDFNAAFGFMTQVALYAESVGHHPEWRNVYNRLEVTLTTHDARGLSHLDIAMARFMDALFGNA
jgi:4a-hydroxytetrahydrobiopterin dehydratase